MPAEPVIRPMREADVHAVHALAVVTFDDLARRRGEPPEPYLDPALGYPRFVHLLSTDPAGAWGAEDARGIAGCSLAILREGLWGLSLLIVRPDLQSAGLGRELLKRAHAYARGARGRVILASPDPRALRAYARLGLTAHPCVRAIGTPRGVNQPDGVRDGTAADIPFTAEVDRVVRGAARRLATPARSSTSARAPAPMSRGGSR